ncbi:ankyrin repeat-containing domain protein [Aspergillus floccosus]
MSSYQLTPDDLDTSTDVPPAIRAARNPNPAVLQALLNYYLSELPHVAHLAPRDRGGLEQCSPNADISGAIDCIYESPLTAAIRAGLPDNVRALLAAGADPTGIRLHYLSDYSVRFIRGRDAKTDMSSFALCPPRESILTVAAAKGIQHQIQPLTTAELDERRSGFPRFWTEPNLPGQRFRSTKALTALEVAAACGQEQMFDLLRDAGADESAWTQTPPSSNSVFVEDNEPSRQETTPSALSTSSPVHEAIAAGHSAMLHKLLHQHHYSPNYRPLTAAPTLALPPLSYALACCDPDDPNIRECITELRSHPNLDPHLRTPIFDIHPLHFAVARHSPALLSWLALPLSSAGATALGHTLLHIASLPQTSESIDETNPDVVRSIHCARTLDPAWLPHPSPSPLHLRPQPRSRLNPLRPRARTPLTLAEQHAQLQILRVLVDAGIDVTAQDVDGNTALHYLAATLNVDPRAMQLLRDMDAGEEAYHHALNREGLSPRALWESRSQ